MKKFLVLSLVLAVASMANAGVLQISVNGNQDPVDSEIWLNPSDELILDIWTLGNINYFETHNWALVVDTTYGSISGGLAVFATPGTTNSVEGLTDDNAGVLPEPPLAGIWGQLAHIPANFQPIPDGTTLIDQILFHCEGPGDAVVQLYAIQSGQPFGGTAGGTLLDEVIIHQTPEPMTVALLGLGGLFLRRRKTT